jgi:hypothetical protein
MSEIGRGHARVPKERDPRVHLGLLASRICVIGLPP